MKMFGHGRSMLERLLARRPNLQSFRNVDLGAQAGLIDELARRSWPGCSYEVSEIKE